MLQFTSLVGSYMVLTFFLGSTGCVGGCDCKRGALRKECGLEMNTDNTRVLKSGHGIEPTKLIGSI